MNDRNAALMIKALNRITEALKKPDEPTAHEIVAKWREGCLCRLTGIDVDGIRHESVYPGICKKCTDAMITALLRHGA